MHLDFATPNFYCQEDWFSGSHPDWLDYDASFENGWLTMADRPGIGVTIDETMLRPFEASEHPHLRRPDGAVQDW